MPTCAMYVLNRHREEANKVELYVKADLFDRIADSIASCTVAIKSCSLKRQRLDHAGNPF